MPAVGIYDAPPPTAISITINDRLVYILIIVCCAVGTFSMSLFGNPFLPIEYIRTNKCINFNIDEHVYCVVCSVHKNVETTLAP